MEFHVTGIEKQDIKQIPRIRTTLSKTISSEPYDGNNIQVNLPDANSEIAQIKVDLRNKVNRSEMQEFQAAEATRQVNEQSRQNQFNQSNVNEAERVRSENERQTNERRREEGFQSLNTEVNNTLQQTRQYVSTLENSLMSYIDRSIITNADIDRMIQSALL